MPAFFVAAVKVCGQMWFLSCFLEKCVVKCGFVCDMMNLENEKFVKFDSVRDGEPCAEEMRRSLCGSGCGISVQIRSLSPKAWFTRFSCLRVTVDIGS